MRTRGNTVFMQQLLNVTMTPCPVVCVQVHEQPRSSQQEIPAH